MNTKLSDSRTHRPLCTSPVLAWKKAQRRCGFTLMEVMLVIILLGILAAITVPRFAGRSTQAKIAAASTDIKGTIGVVLDLYEMDNGAYPSTDQGLEALVNPPRSGASADNWNGPYIKGEVPEDPWGNEYQYRSPGQHNERGYDMWSFGPDEIDGTEDDITNW